MRHLQVLSSAFMGVAMATSLADAAPVPHDEGRKLASAMREGPRVAAPFAFLKFCARHPNECIASAALTAGADADFHHDIKVVNDAVNAEITPRNDVPGNDAWSLAPGQGDCEDYALTKRSRLIAKGWSPSLLRLAIVHAPGYGPHVILVARTKDGDVLLDNLTDRISPWYQVNYHFISGQSSDNPRQWQSLSENNLRASM